MVLVAGALTAAACTPASSLETTSTMEAPTTTDAPTTTLAVTTTTPPSTTTTEPPIEPVTVAGDLDPDVALVVEAGLRGNLLQYDHSARHRVQAADGEVGEIRVAGEVGAPSTEAEWLRRSRPACVFPLRFVRQTVNVARQFGEPIAECHRLPP